jgi:hypothetical protein
MTNEEFYGFDENTLADDATLWDDYTVDAQSTYVLAPLDSHWAYAGTAAGLNLPGESRRTICPDHDNCIRMLPPLGHGKAMGPRDVR